MGSWQDYLARQLKSRGLSELAVDTVIKSIRPSTQKQYSVYINRFIVYCGSHSLVIERISEINVVNFLQTLFDSGSGYSTINTACSAVLYFLTLCGLTINDTGLLSKYKKGVFNKRPALPRYVDTWDPQIVLSYFSSQENKNNSLLFIASKAATLLALASCSRIATLHSILLKEVEFKDSKVVIHISQLQKQSRPGFHQSAIVLHKFQYESQCVVTALVNYVQATKHMRESCLALTNLFITTVKPYRNASKDTVSRWIKDTIHAAGVPVNFKAHSTRSAATSDLLKQGFDVKTILSKAGWSSENVFYKFYKRV